jgi:multicomponent Na+:H+ antiporter subunit A
MAAPTPVSAYLHSATMVKAGIYLLARLAPVFGLVGFWRPAVIAMGLLTMVAGGLRALRQTDLKLLLAFGTVSQLGFMTVLFGLGTPEAVTAGCVLLLAHGFFKAALFMVVGILDHQTGTRDIDELPALDQRWRPVLVVAAISAASMAGLPLVFGFIAKEAAYEAVIDAAIGGEAAVLALLTAGSAITMAYSIRFVWGAFYAAREREPTSRALAAESTPPSTAFLLPAAVLAAFTLVLGLVPGALDRLVSAADRALLAPERVHLVIWHGVNLPLLLTLAAIAGGIVLFALRRQLGGLWAFGARIPDSGSVYLGTLRALNIVANRTTAVVQNGSLPIYAGVILLTATLPVVVLLRDAPWPGLPAEGGFGQLLVSVVIIGSATAAAVHRRRLSAVLLLGVTGYGMAALFLVRGAPDLALTQVTIETLSTVVFVLVLRRLPDRFERRSVASLRVLRVAIAALVGAGVFVFAIIAGGNRIDGGVAEDVIARAYPDGHGRNVVNVVLVDFRALDTVGEITVLAAAAIGAVALARAGRRPPGIEPPAAATAASAGDSEPLP